MRRSVVDTSGMEMNVNTHALKGLFLGVFVLVGACGGGSKPPPGSPCVKNSDCTNPLSCSYGLCHVTCTEARDCPTGQDCVKAAAGNVCQLPIETKCEYLSQCSPPLVCALDRQCRSQCLKDIDCPTPTEKCVLPDMVCAEPGEINQTTGLLKNALGTPVPAAPPDAGAGDGATGDGGVNAVIGAAGGTVSGDGATVVVPAGALAQDQTVSIQVAPSGYPALPTGAVLLSGVLALEPHGQLFSKPVTVSIGFTARPGTTPELITASPGGSWAAVAGATVSGASMQAMVAHFSFFAVIGQNMDGGAGGTTGTGGVGGCASPQTSFGFIGQGDSNQNFQSGVGALGTNVMYIFSSYVAPPSDAGVQDYEIYVQAFDPKTGASKGPSRSLFVVPTLGFSPRVPTEPQQVYLAAAAVAPTGDIVLLYDTSLEAAGGGGYGFFAAFLSPAPAGGGADGGSVDGLKLQRVVLVSDNFVSQDAPVTAGVAATPQVIWSNASQTFIVEWQHGGGGTHMAMNKYSVSGQTAGGLDPIPTLAQLSSTYGSVGESGNLLGVAYRANTAAGPSPSMGLTILDESENLVGTPIAVGYGNPQEPWASVAGTAQGFVYFSQEFGLGALGEVFVSTSPNAGIIGADASADAGIATLPEFKFSGTFNVVRTISDNVGTGGKGGVGVALSSDSDSNVVSFAYVNADGVGHQGPYQVFAQGGGSGAMSMANFNGSFVISTYTSSMHSAQVIATGICP